jgi:Acetyl-CoA dehydrogenase C-terminal like
LLQHAEVASAALAEATDDDKAFYTGKIASARFFVREALPKVAMRTSAAQAEDGSIMDIPVEAF